MPNLSKEFELSDVYNNHSIRVTGVTILSKANFNPGQIMAITGHKSVQSLAVYDRVCSQEKIEMGQALGDSLKPSRPTASNFELNEPNFNLECDILDFLDEIGDDVALAKPLPGFSASASAVSPFSYNGSSVVPARSSDTSTVVPATTSLTSPVVQSHSAATVLQSVTKEASSFNNCIIHCVNIYTK
jgi:hypothetical protein